MITGTIRFIDLLKLQGYQDGQIDRMVEGMSDSQLYKQAGNGVTVNVIEAIGRNLCLADQELEQKETGKEQ